MQPIPEARGAKIDLLASRKVCTEIWRYRRLFSLACVATALCTGIFFSRPTAASQLEAEAKPIQVRVVLVTMFEIGADEGDAAGKFQLWKPDEV